MYSCSVFETCWPVQFHKDGERTYFITNKGSNVNLIRLAFYEDERLRIYWKDKAYETDHKLLQKRLPDKEIDLYIASEVVASVAQAGEVGAQEPEHTGSM